MRKAFTLIEVMVVLSILALIAILAYNFFGSTIKEARTKQAAVRLVEVMQDLSDAVESYVIDNGRYPPSGGYESALGTLNGGWLDSYLKNDAFAPPESIDANCDSSPNLHISLDSWNNPSSPTTAKDYYVGMRCVAPEVCQKINALYAPSIGDAIHDSLSATTFPVPEEYIYCTKIAASRYSAIFTIEMI